MKRLLLAAAAAGMIFCSQSGDNTAVAQHRKRAKPKYQPPIKLCNKSKRNYKFATMRYSGRGTVRTQGWMMIRRGKCRMVRAGSFYFRGAKRVGGMVSSWKRSGCVKFSARFNIRGSRSDVHGNKAKCRKRKGRLFNFSPPNMAARKITIWR